MFSANASQVSNDVKYIEDFCSVYLRTGTGSSQTVTTGVKENTGALVISKSRSAATDWAWYDTFRGATKELASNTTAAEITQSQGLTSFNTDGHTWGTLAKVNTSGATYVDFVLKPTPKFFDVVTYTGNGNPAGQVINHNLGSIPGFIICKATSTTGDWAVCARTGGASSPASSITYATGLSLNSTGAALYSGTLGDFPTATTFSTAGIFDNPGNYPNVNGVTYVAYLFAHNAGGFGLTGTDNVISCGSFTASSGAATVTLGYEPQWVLYKRTDGTDNWKITDNMRGMFAPGGTEGFLLYPNLSNAETQAAGAPYATATGFSFDGVNNGPGSTSGTYIYIAIRRGPMKTPTTGTSVYNAIARTGTGGSATITGAGFSPDFYLSKARNQATYNPILYDRLRGYRYLLTSSTGAEPGSDGGLVSFNMDGVSVTGGSSFGLDGSGDSIINWFFRRAPGFFDEVCYTTGAGTGQTTFNHNLGVTPELVISKTRSAVDEWYVYAQPLGTSKTLYLNGNVAEQGFTCTDSLSSTQARTYLGVGSATAVSYLFASCPGVSKVGSYTGTGNISQSVNCGFTAGSRFVLIKRTDSTGDWYVWDSARGIVAGNDPYLLLNSTAAEVTTTDYVDTFSSGFEISSTAPAAINASGGTFIYLAIA